AASSCVPVAADRVGGVHAQVAREETHGSTHSPRVGIRPEVAHALTARTTVEKCSRNALANGYRQHRISFIVTVFDVEARIEFLNPRIFQRKSFYFAGNNRPLDARRGLHHLASARMQLRDVLEIVREPRAKVFRLPDISNAFIFIAEFIYAWICRDGSRSRPVSAWICHGGHLPFLCAGLSSGMYFASSSRKFRVAAIAASLSPDWIAQTGTYSKFGNSMRAMREPSGKDMP